jgi:hypothetical protein
MICPSIFIDCFDKSYSAFFNRSGKFSLNTARGQTRTHFLQPLQACAFSMTICLCHKKPAFPITRSGQASIHLQQALQLWGFAQT